MATLLLGHCRLPAIVLAAIMLRDPRKPLTEVDYPREVGYHSKSKPKHPLSALVVGPIQFTSFERSAVLGLAGSEGRSGGTGTGRGHKCRFCAQLGRVARVVRALA